MIPFGEAGVSQVTRIAVEFSSIANRFCGDDGPADNEKRRVEILNEYVDQVNLPWTNGLGRKSGLTKSTSELL